MKAFQQLVCKLKVSCHDLQTLHRRLTDGEGQWFTIHELLDDYHAELAAMTDDLIEIGLSVGVQEPGIAEAVKEYQPIQAKNRNPRETLNDIRVLFTDIADMMQAIGTQLDEDQRYIQSKLDEYIYYLRKEADYKLARA